MTKKKKYDGEDGVWRTIGGRRVFIRKGASLSEAMKESGKFKKASDIKRGTYQRENAYNEHDRTREKFKKAIDERREIDTIIREKTYDENYDDNSFFESSEYEKMKNRRGKLLEKEKKLTDEMNEYEKEYNTRLYGSRYDDYPKRYKGDISKLDGKHISNRKLSDEDIEDKFYTRKDGTKEYDPYKGTRFEKKYDSVEEALNDPNHPTRKYIDEKLNWHEQVKRNNELMEKELEDYKKKHDISRESDGYYEIFRNNERRNAKIKQEVPTEPYEYVEAYAGYHDKSYKLAGTKMSGKDVVEYGRKSWTGKEYTNDEFMEHLTDSNWHQERKMLEEAKLTNQELAYIKDRTTLSQWSVGEELTGSKNVEKMIKEAKNHFASSSSNLMNRYSGTVSYLQSTTNMSSAEILELLKKIDEDKK